MTLSLRVSTPILSGTTAYLDVTRYMQGYRRSIRGRGGYWSGELVMTGPEVELARLFYEYLGGHFEERSSGAKTWEGMLYEMELTYPTPKNNGVIVSRRRSLDLMYNYVYGKYTTTAGATNDLAAASNANSIARYGRREEYLLINGVAQTPAQARRDVFLKEHAWPWPRVTSVQPVQERGQATLSIMLCGYMLTANWRYRTAGDGTDGALGAYINTLITTDCATYLKVGKISTNSMTVKRGSTQPIRAGDLIFNLTDLGDASANPYWIYVHNDRQVVYEIIPETPRYFMHSGRIYETAGGSSLADPWKIKPGVFRDLTYPVRKTEIGGWLDDVRDFYVSEVEVGTGAGLVLKTEIFEEAEILAAQAEYAAQGATGGMGGTSGGGGSFGEDRDPVSGRRNWYVAYARVNKIKDIKQAQALWQKMSLAERINWKKVDLKAWRKNREKKKK